MPHNMEERNSRKMFLRKKEEAGEIRTEVNENFLNIISPAGIDFTETHTSLGENIGKIYAVVSYPQSADYGWLSLLCNIEGTSTIIQYRHSSPDKLVKNFNKRIDEFTANADMIKNESERQLNQKAIEDLKKMIHRISIKNEPVGYVNIMFHVQDTDEERLNARIKILGNVAAVQSCTIKLLKYKQGQALKVFAPYGIPDRMVFNMGERNMPLSTLMGGFPMANPGIYDDGGYYLGKTTNNKLVIVNQWLRSKDRTNSNWFITGVPGVGKSTALKNIFTKESAFGTKIIVFDPEEEYVDLAQHPDINGNVVSCIGGSRGRINPLQIRSAARVKQEDLDEGESMEDFFSYGDADDASDMSLYIQQLRVFFTLYFGEEEMTSGVRAALEKSLIKLYNKFGITWDTDVRTLGNEDFPYMEHLYQQVKEDASGEELTGYRKECYEKLQDLLYSAGEGADRLWNGPTTISAQGDFTDLVVSGLLETDDKVKRAQFYNIITWGWHEVSKNRQEKVLFGLDEGYLFVDPELVELMKFIRNMSKRIRKYEGGLMFITHSVVDVLSPEVKRLGQAIIDNACYKFIMGTDGKNLRETTELFNLSEREVNILTQKNRGQGIFFAGNIRLDLTVDVSDEFLEMFGNAGGR